MKIRLAKKIVKRLISILIDNALFNGALKNTFPYSQGDRATAEKVWTKEVQKREIRARGKFISLSRQTARELNRRYKELQSTIN